MKRGYPVAHTKIDVGDYLDRSSEKFNHSKVKGS